MELTNLLKFKTSLTDFDRETLRDIQGKIDKTSITPDRTKTYIIPIVELIHRGLATDPVVHRNWSIYLPNPMCRRCLSMRRVIRGWNC